MLEKKTIPPISSEKIFEVTQKIYIETLKSKNEKNNNESWNVCIFTYLCLLGYDRHNRLYMDAHW